MTLMPIGRFAKACRLSVKSLRDYDRSGLLTAAFVDPDSGYRYYQLDQLGRAHQIRALRLLEMPLSQIQAVLGSDDPEPLLASYLADLFRETEEIHRRVHQIRHLIEAKELTMSTDIVVKSVPSQTVAASRVTATHSAVFTAIPAGFSAVLTYLTHHRAAPVGAPFTIFHAFPEADSPGDLSLCVPVAQGVPSSPGIEVTVIPGGPACSVLHRGSYAEMAGSYERIATWIHQRGHRITGPSREIYLNSPADVDEDELLTEILWPIEEEAS